MKTTIGCTVLWLALAGCAGIEPKPGFTDVQREISARTGETVEWREDAATDAAVKRTIKELLTNELGADTAVRVALLNNAALQAAYEKLGLSRADVISAGILANPILSAKWRASSVGSGREFGVTQDFLHLLTLVPRKRAALAAFESTKLEVAETVTSLAAEVKQQYYAVVASEAALALDREAAQAAQAAADLGRRQYEAGNISRRDQAAQALFSAQALLAANQAQARLQTEREKLTRMLGLWGDDISWRVPPSLPDVPDGGASLEALETRALEARLDLRVAKLDAESIKTALATSKSMRFLSALGIGYHYERATDGEKLKGPSIEVGLPLFDRNQVQIARLESSLRERERNAEALGVNIRSQVRAARGEMQSAQERAKRYRDTLLPLHREIVSESLKFYNGMLIGVYELLRAKQDELVAKREYVRAAHDYWMAVSELERAAGTTIAGLAPTATPAAAQPTQPPAQRDQHEHHHQ
jgi:outer membrane protein, heavy metal efflux system